MKKLLLLIAGLGIGYYLLTQRLGSLVAKAGSYFLEVPVSVVSAGLSPFSGAVTLNGLAVANPAGFSDSNFFSVNQVAVVSEIKTLWTSNIHLYSVVIDGANFVYEMGLSGSNLSAFQGQLSSGEPTAVGTPTILTIDKLVLTNSVVTASLFGLQKAIKLPSVELDNLQDTPDKILLAILGKIAIGVV